MSACVLSDAGYFVGSAAASTQTPCEPGTISGAASSECSLCSPGSFQSDFGQASCQLASAGSYVGDAGESNETLCPPGSFSGSGASECDLCSPPFYNPDEGQTECTAAAAGTAVSEDGATEQVECPPGYWSSAASTECTACSQGSYNNETAQSECRLCSAPLYTLGEAATYCDACRKNYYWDSVYWDSSGRDELRRLGEECLDCCVECDDDGMKCRSIGARLESLEVSRGYWRATKVSTDVYECDLSGACLGGNDTRTKVQCHKGHTGALCGACRHGYDYDPVENKCLECGPLSDMFESAGTLVCAVLVFVICGLLLFKKFGKKEHWEALKRMAILICTGKFNLREADKMGDDIHNKQALRKQQSKEEAEADARRQQFMKSVMTKIKICVAAYQIASSTQFVMPQIQFPDLFNMMLRATGILGLDFMQLGSTDCVVRLSYFHKLVVTTLFPFVLAVVVTLAVFVRLWIKYRLGHYRNPEVVKRKAQHKLIYFFLLLVFVALPTCSSSTFRYFSCIRYDRGSGRKDLHALRADPTIQCTSSRYHGWLWYVILMIFCWPVGTSISLAFAM